MSICTLGSCSLDSLRHLAFSSSPADVLGRDESYHLSHLSAADSHTDIKETSLPAFRTLTAALVFCDSGLHEGAGPQPLLSGRV